jgi:hypothetical protein
MPNFVTDYFTTTGPNAGLYVNPADNQVVQSGKQCGSILEFPCAFVKNTEAITINATSSPCTISWCKLYNAILSIAGSQLIVANDTSEDIALTDPQIACAVSNANLILSCV